jgi:hypothetical protein
MVLFYHGETMKNTSIQNTRKFQKWIPPTAKICPRNAQKWLQTRLYFGDGRFFGVVTVKGVSWGYFGGGEGRNCAS